VGFEGLHPKKLQLLSDGMLETMIAVIQQNFQASYEDDNYEDLFFNAFMMNHTWADFETRKRKHESSFLRQKPNLERESQCGQDRIWRDYFCASIVYDDKLFRWRYQMK